MCVRVCVECDEIKGWHLGMLVPERQKERIVILNKGDPSASRRGAKFHPENNWGCWCQKDKKERILILVFMQSFSQNQKAGT